MEKLTQRYQSLVNILQQLERSLQLANDPQYELIYEQIRLAAMQAFNLTYELLSNYLKHYLTTKHLILLEHPSPRKIFRAGLDSGLLNKEEFKQLSNLAEDRNRVIHSYNEQTAEDVLFEISNHYKYIKSIIAKLKPE